MYVDIYDTKFDDYVSNVVSRIRRVREHMEHHNPGWSWGERSGEVIDFIVYDEFTKTRLPGIVGLDALREVVASEGRIYAHTKRDDVGFLSSGWVTFPIPDSEVKLREEDGWVGISSAFPTRAARRPGIETGKIDTIEKHLLVFCNDRCIVSDSYNLPVLPTTRF